MTQFVRNARIGAILIGACALIAGSAVPASAATPASDKEKKQEVPGQSGARPVLICVDGYTVTGSRIPRPRECKTRAEWIKTTGIDPLTDR